MKKTTWILPIIFTAIIFSCNNGTNSTALVSKDSLKKEAEVTSGKPANQKPADAATILQRQEVPVLCYHHIREWKATDSKRAHDYIVPPDNFQAQMKLLSDSGYHSVSPDELYAYLLFGKPLPAKPFMLTYDDTDEEQFTIGKTEMDKYGFKGTFFIMTISLNKPRYMTQEQVKQLAAEGHTIGSHTWDHKNVKLYTDVDWATELDKPTQLLESLAGKKINFFAYPFGLWNEAAVAKLKEKGFIAAFQLSEKRDENDPLHTIRRIIVPGSWSAPTVLNVMKRSFH
jgi:peptidoglycan/xylan/chitin deacetylase (PgdA/CDA1 family)